jgi:class 3 adenylate cyclase
MPSQLTIITILFLLFGPARIGMAAPALKVDASAILHALPADPYLEIWEDATKTAGIEDLLQSPRPFRDLTAETPRNTGYSKAIYWVRFRVENTSGTELRLYLEATDPQQYLDFYALDGTGQNIVDRQSIGSFRPPSQQRLHYRFPVLEVVAQPGIQTYYFRMDVVAVTFPYSFWTRSELKEKGWKDRAALTFFFGCFMIMALYNLLLGISTKRLEYFLYCGYLLSFMLLQTFVTGSGFLFFGDSWTLANHCMPVWITLTAIFTLQFSSRFLGLGQNRMNFIRRILDAYSVLALAYCAYALWDLTEAMKYVPLVLTGMPFVVYAGVKRAMAGDRPALYYIIGWVCFLLGAGALLLYFIGIFKGSHEVSWVMLIAVAFETIFFSLGIGERLRLEIETSMREQAILLDRHRREVEARSHAYQQLGKVFYPHQLQKMEQGYELETTMPTAPGQACVIQLDVVNSSQIWLSYRKEFLISFLKRCHEIMMQNYDAVTMQADAYRIKEMGDGFLCSVGYPFQLPGSENAAIHAVRIAEKFIEVFRQCAESLMHEEPVHCSIGIAMGEIEGFYPNTGTKEYDLYGQGIILANRYEALRKQIFETVDFDILIIQDEVYQRLPEDMQRNFSCLDLNTVNFRVRDDPLAVLVYYRRFSGSSGSRAA